VYVMLPGLIKVKSPVSTLKRHDTVIITFNFLKPTGYVMHQKV
jgi:hypothetical protein